MADSHTPTGDRAAPYRQGEPPTRALTASTGSTGNNPYAKDDGKTPKSQKPASIPALFGTATGKRAMDNPYVRPGKRPRQPPVIQLARKKRIVSSQQQLQLQPRSDRDRASRDTTSTGKISRPDGSKRRRRGNIIPVPGVATPGAAGNADARRRSAAEQHRQERHPDLPGSTTRKSEGGRPLPASSTSRQQQKRKHDDDDIKPRSRGPAATATAAAAPAAASFRRVPVHPPRPHKPKSSRAEPRPPPFIRYEPAPSLPPHGTARTVIIVSPARQAPSERVGCERFRPPSRNENRPHRRTSSTRTASRSACAFK